MYKVRFHLGAGEHFMHWQVKDTITGEVKYYNPDEYHIQMIQCRLKNHRRTAEKIFNGENKTVCAWIECKHIAVQPRNYMIYRIIGRHTLISYNPKKAPYWVNRLNDNIDNDNYLEILTNGRNLFALKYL